MVGKVLKLSHGEIKTFGLSSEGPFGATGPGKTDGVNANFATPVDAILALPAVKAALAQQAQPCKQCLHYRLVIDAYENGCPCHPQQAQPLTDDDFVMDVSVMIDKEIGVEDHPHDTMALARNIIAKTRDRMAQQAQPETLACARVQRSEHHDAHKWIVQPEDDSPHTERVKCPGYKAQPEMPTREMIAKVCAKAWDDPKITQLDYATADAVLALFAPKEPGEPWHSEYDRFTTPRTGEEIQ